MLNYRGEHGFSLMELLIVMTIMGLLMSIVAPLSLSAISKSEARVELQEVKIWLKELGNEAFITQLPITVQFDRNIANVTSDYKIQDIKIFKDIYFKTDTVYINSFGEMQPEKVFAKRGGQDLVIYLHE